MFRAQPTPYGQFIPYGLHMNNAAIPSYTFASTPLLAQFGERHVGGSPGGDGIGGAGVRGGPPATTDAFAASPSNFHAAGGGSGNAGSIGTSTTGAASASSYSGNNNHGSGHTRPVYNNNSIPRHSRYHRTQRQQHQHQNQHQHQHQHQHLRHPTNRDHALRHEMDQQQPLDQSEIARQEAAARDYKPQLEGPLVGEKLSSQAIAEEYAGADPIYVAKTMALTQTYSHYRPILGDGNCGWRAIAFAYFETLVRCSDINLVQHELKRMTELNDYIEKVGGQDPSMFELMVSDTFDLFNDIILAMSEGNDPMPSLMAKFNEVYISSCLVYHLRLLACSQLKGNAAHYEPYLAGNLQDYIDATVMPANREIDHICLVLLHAILLKPVNMVLEIAYLDRSEGTQVTVHRFSNEATEQDSSTLGPIIYLLYRPGHYDILYRDSQIHIPSIPSGPTPVDLQVHRVAYNDQDFQTQEPALQTAYDMDMSGLAVLIPGFPSGLSPPLGVPSTTPSPMTDPYAPSPSSSWVPQHYSPESISAPPPLQPSPPLRFSKYNFPNLPEMAAENNNNYEPTPMTNTFKNSHYNVAHYNNLHFQPEMYKPDAEEEPLSSGSGRIGGRKRSSEHCSGIKREKQG
ncbi:peptidase C65 Otubain-domain-containing protein [Xylariaceae sp. FL1651]|nr:peptidase C65 Otubain-domain-containing protein [Xylariaceae sp. FL1651]